MSEFVDKLSENSDGNEEQHEPVTLLEEVSARAKQSLRFATSHFRRVKGVVKEIESVRAFPTGLGEANDSARLPGQPEPNPPPARVEERGQAVEPCQKNSSAGPDVLLERLFAKNAEIHLLQTSLKQEAEQRKELEEKVEALAASKRELEECLRKPVPNEKPLAAEQETAQPQAYENSLQSSNPNQNRFEETIEQLNNELKANRETIAELKKTIEEKEAGLREAQARTLGEVSDYEKHFSESASACARLSTELGAERAERRRAEECAAALTPQIRSLQDQISSLLGTQRHNKEAIDRLEKQLHEGKESFMKLVSDLETERSDRKLAEEQLNAGHQLCDQLRHCLSSFEEARKKYQKSKAA